MRFRVERDAFADAVAWAARTLPLRPPVPVLAGLLLELGDDGLRLSSFDYDVSALVTIDVSAVEDGRALVSGRLLADITRNLPARPIDVALEGPRLNLTCGSSRFALPTLPVDDYPTLPAMPALSGSVSSDVFATAVAQVATAAGRDDTLPVLTGVRMEIDNANMTLAATDRYRLAIRNLTWEPDGGEIATAALVPARTLSDTAKSLTSGARIGLALSTGSTGDSMIGFEGSGRRTTARLLDGEFPKYRSLLPSATSANAELAVPALAEALKRVSLVNPRGASVRLSFTAGELVLEAGGGEDAQAVESLECDFDGEELSIAFNPGYLLDGLGALETDLARMQFTTPTKPALLTGKDDGDFTYLLMPVRLSG